LGAYAYEADMRRALREKLMIRRVGNTVSVAVLPLFLFFLKQTLRSCLARR
jgi:hypothetical protein